MKPGIYTMPADQYHADPAPQPSLSASVASIICQESPAHAKVHHPRLTEQVVEGDAEHFDIGSICHALILEGETIADVLPFDDWRTKAARFARDESRTAGRVPILEKNWTRVQEMVGACRAQLDMHRDSRDAFAAGKPEQTLIWQDEGGLWCRARLDWLHDTHKKISDYKTTSVTANPETVSRTLFSNGWDVKAAFYLRGLKALTGIEAQFRFVVQETRRPYAICVMALGPDSMIIGEKKTQYAIEVFGKCLATGEWPAYPRRTCWAILPKWEEERWLAKELANAV